jgi:hypothetical protein
MPYWIGFLNPWRGKAENQAFASLQIAAQRIGHELVHVTNSDEIIEANLDFVLAVHPNQPKTTDVPTFGVIHSPRALLLEHDYYGRNLLTYDGYLTNLPAPCGECRRRLPHPEGPIEWHSARPVPAPEL